MDIFISAGQLYGNFTDPDLFIADCRGDLDPSWGPLEYEKGHIPGAFFINGEHLLTGAHGGIHGGRHPMPFLHDFRHAMELLGIGDSSTVVAYGFWAGRLLFLFHCIGFTSVKILDGGMQAWIDAGYPVTGAVPSARHHGKLTGAERHDLVHSMQDVRLGIHHQSITLLDARAPQRFDGSVDAVDPVAGHIPGAMNFFWEEMFDSDGLLLSKEKLLEKIDPFLQKGKPLVIYCGSGITGASVYAMLRHIGIGSTLYAGGWSDWITYAENIPEKKQEPSDHL